MKHIDALIEDDGAISLGATDGGECTAAADQHKHAGGAGQARGERLTALLKQLDRALLRRHETVDEVN